jgi:hypothetical protein
MAIAGSDFPLSINRADLEISFHEGIKRVLDADFEMLLTLEESPVDTKRVTFYGDKPNMRIWKGEKQPQNFEEYKLNMFTHPRELTYEWKESELNRETDPAKHIRREVTTMGEAHQRTKQDLFWRCLRNGVSVMGFDKHPLYGPTHRYVNSRGATNSTVSAQSNVHWGGSQLDATTLQLEEEHYVNLRTDKNRQWGLKLTHVLVKQGSANHVSARELANSQYTTAISTAKGQNTVNVFQGAFSILTTNDIEWGASEWASFALNLDSKFRPIVVLSETVNPGWDNPKFVATGLDDMTNTSEGRFWRGTVATSIESYWDYNPGYWFTTRLHGSSGYSPTAFDFENQRTKQPNI